MVRSGIGITHGSSVIVLHVADAVICTQKLNTLLSTILSLCLNQALNVHASAAALNPKVKEYTM